MMNDVLINICVALISGSLGVFLGIFINYKLKMYYEQVSSLRTLIAYIDYPAQMERVVALNTIPIVFNKNKKICSLFEEYKKAQNELTANINNIPVFPHKLETLNDSYIKIIEAIAIELHFNSTVTWDKLKNHYSPRLYVDINNQQHWY